MVGDFDTSSILGFRIILEWPYRRELRQVCYQTIFNVIFTNKYICFIVV